MKKQTDKFIEVTDDGKQEIEEGKESLDKPGKKYPVDAAQSNYQDAQTEEQRKKLKKDELKGGLADKNKPSDFDKKQLEMGIKVEMEHTDDKKLAREIAMDHLKEIPDYYTRLKDMEEEAEVSKSLRNRWELIKEDLKHKKAFMDIDIEDDDDEDGDSEKGDQPSDDELQSLLQAVEGGGDNEVPTPQQELSDDDGDGILEGNNEGDQPDDDEDMEEGGDDIPEDVVEEAGGEEVAEKMSNDEIEKLMTEMGYSPAEIAHVIHGHTVHVDPEDDRDQEMHEHEMQAKKNELAMQQAKTGLEHDHVKSTNSIDLDRVNQLNDIEIEHERRMKELDYNMARRARELELKFKEKELEQKLQHKDDDAKAKRSSNHNSKKHERKLVDNIVN